MVDVNVGDGIWVGDEATCQLIRELGEFFGLRDKEAVFTRALAIASIVMEKADRSGRIAIKKPGSNNIDVVDLRR